MSSESKETQGFDVFRAVRGARDAGMEEWAKRALRLTSSARYLRISHLLGRPLLVAADVLRKAREAAMEQLLAQLSMPSREDVLALSKRLTHIEMVLDDVSAAVAAARPSSAKTPRPHQRGREANAHREGNAQRGGHSAGLRPQAASAAGREI